MEYQKYPRTPHVPWSRKTTEDDIQVSSLSSLKNKMIVVTEKMDGEGTTMYRKYIHARSIDSNNHPSRDYVKAIHNAISYLIPKNMRLVGENCFAKHSIFYDDLPGVFLGFAAFQDGICLSWKEIRKIYFELGIHTVPVLYKGPYSEEAIKKCYTGMSKFGGVQEGYVIRNADEFPESEFGENVYKFVRKNHVQTDQFWMSKPIIRNKLRMI